MAKKKKDMSWLLDDEDDTAVEVKDSNGVILQAWDTVIAIKDLSVKGSWNIKRGDKFSKIRLTDEPELIESGKMVLKTEFFKKI